ncbi:MAG: hypothetical protein VX589_01020, partial [Myxococcota bacterium]|nr:hypothetical protein [Myxococcota bacterium]
IIISEPSNPWVSGVASLFSQEFYARITKHMSPGGILAQWIQLYELEPALVVSILKALRLTFPTAVVYATNNNNLLILARRDGPVGPLSEAPLRVSEIRDELARHGILGMADLRLHRIADLPTLEPLLKTFNVPANSDYFPYLDNHAVKARFLQKSAKNFVRLTLGTVPLMSFLSPEDNHPLDAPSPYPIDQPAPSRRPLLRQANVDHARRIAASPLQKTGELSDVNEVAQAVLAYLKRHAQHCATTAALTPRQQLTMSDALHTLGKMTNGYLPPDVALDFWTHLRAELCPGRLGESPNLWLDLMIQIAGRRQADMGRTAERLLASAAPLTDAQRATLVSCRLLHLIAQPDPAGALQLWNRHRAHLGHDDARRLRFRLLLAHAAMPGRGPNAP